MLRGFCWNTRLDGAERTNCSGPGEEVSRKRRASAEYVPGMGR